MPCLLNKFNRRQFFKIIVIEAFFHIKIGMGFFKNISFIKRGNSLIQRFSSQIAPQPVFFNDLKFYRIFLIS